VEKSRTIVMQDRQIKIGLLGERLGVGKKATRKEDLFQVCAALFNG
jgi:hypothetical protein